MSRARLLALGAAGVAATLAIFVAGCGLTADYSGLTGGYPPEAAPPEDAADSEAAAAPGYCAALEASSSPPLVCEDFDRQNGWAPSWMPTTMNGTLGVDGTLFASPPNSLFAKDTAFPLDTALRAIAIQPPSPFPTTVDLSFSIRHVSVTSMNGNDRLVAAALDFLDGMGQQAPRYSLQLTLVQSVIGGQSSVSLWLEEQSSFASNCPYMPHPPHQPLTPDAWSDVHLTWTRTGSADAGPAAGTAKVTIGPLGGSPNDEIDATLCMSVPNPNTLQITIGSSFKMDPASVWENRYDNVTLRVGY
jgi:hypothetical protein